jgi:hypothetical protein
MNGDSFPRAAWRSLLRLALICLFCGMAGGVFLPRAHSQEIASSNASDEETAQINALLGQLNGAVAVKNVNTLRFFGLGNEAASYATLRLDSQLTNLAVAPTGALVRQTYRIIGARTLGATPETLAEGTHEFFLARDDNTGFRFTAQRWNSPTDAVTALTLAAREEWLRPTSVASTPSSNALLHLVAMRRGGRWIALRRSRWEGALLDASNLQSQARGQKIPPGLTLDPAWLRAQMASAPAGSGTAHFLLQRSASGWIGLGMAWDEDEKLSADSDAAAGQARRLVLRTAYATPSAHRAFGIALAKIGLFSEASAELQKAEILEPGSVEENLRQQVEGARANDPAAQAAAQLQNEGRVGLDPNHPSYLVSALMQDYTTQPSVLRALRLGLEYSRLGDDARTDAWLVAAQNLAQQGALRGVNDGDRAWIEVLFQHLQERHQLLAEKPPLIIRSPLFVLRCWPNDLSAVQVLAALEAAQHTVYADFNIPMGCTEVLLWRNQSEFRDYTTRFSSQGQSEFVAALTLTKLISSQAGPVVLGEEVNVFADPRNAVFHTVAHEYGHVAVRQLSHGRNVPVWFNEGIATSVEGGYDGYLERVRTAARANALLSMDEMQAWNVDGERAFLAYSQANSMIDYIAATWGRGAVLNVLRQIGNDVEPSDAFRRVLGISQQELWRRWVKDGIR